MSKMIAYPELFVEEIEINRLIKFLGEKGYQNTFLRMSETFGIIKKQSDTSFTSLQVYNSSSTKVGVKAGVAFTDEGNLIYVATDLADLFTLTNDNTFRKVFIQYATTQIEQGTIQVNSNGSIAGTNTLFTENFKTGKRIEVINSSLGNNGTYDITGVSGDTALTTGHTFTPESGLNYKVKGVFTPNVSIDDAYSRPFWLDTVNITLEADATSETDRKICLARVKNNGGTVTITDARIKFHSLVTEISNSYTTSSTFLVGGRTGTALVKSSDINKDYTTGSTFRIGADYTDLQNPVLGNYALTNVDVSKKVINVANDALADSVKNFIITDVRGAKYGNNLFVDFKWGFHGIQGDTTNGTTFRITSGYNSTTQETIVGQYIYLPGYGNFLINTFDATSGGLTQITSMTATTGTTSPTGSVSFDGSTPCIIHPNASRFYLVAIPVINGSESNDNRVYNNLEFILNNVYDINRTTMKLVDGTVYNIKLVLEKGTYTITKNLPNGSYTKYSATQSYIYPFTALHPNIAADGSITLRDAGNKINVNTSGWADAEEIQVTYSTAGAPSWAGATPIVTSQNRNFDVTVIPGTYFVAVRPVIAKQQVQTPLTGTATVISTDESATVTDSLTLFKTINTFSGTVYSATEVAEEGGYRVFALVINAMFSPSGSSVVANSTIGMNQYLKVGGKSYAISQRHAGQEINFSSSITLYVQDNSNLGTPPTGAFKIGADVDSRKVGEFPIMRLCHVQSISIAHANAIGQGILRIYNYNNPSTYDSVIIADGSLNAQIQQTGNVVFSTGDKMVVTFWDTTGTTNDSSVGVQHLIITTVGINATRVNLPVVQ